MTWSKPPARVQEAAGRIKIHPEGYGFVAPEDRTLDVKVAAAARGGAVDGDRVRIEWWTGPRGREGRVVEVLERGRAKLTGVLAGSPGAYRLTPDDPRIVGAIAVGRVAPEVRAGQSVVAAIAGYPSDARAPLRVDVLRGLGDPEDPRTEIDKILATANIDEVFPAAAQAMADATPRTVRDVDRQDRTDLRGVPFATIDPETARDFDDAVALEARPGGGHRLWVAVADVSHYVREGTPLDAEARRRGVSVYLPHKAIPMLPEALSAHICSLVADEDRLAMVARVDFDGRDEIVDTEFSAAVIRSRARLAYPGVAAALAGDFAGERARYREHAPALRAMDALARRLRQKRRERGALDLDLPEPVVELDRDDARLVRDVRQARRDPGERAAYAMIEEFMLVANEAVGASFAARREDVVWRVHEPPDEDKLAAFVALAERHGVRVKADEARTPRGMAALIARLKGHPAERPLSFLLLRSLKQAAYDVVNVGHFGLASRAYLHFTSPIRRYPDVVAHRLLKRRLAMQGKPAGGFPALDRAPAPPRAPELQTAAAESSFAERRAMEVEREVVNLYRAFFMRDRVGDEFEGSITGVAPFGLFVTIAQPFVEGLVRVSDLGRDYFEYDEAAQRLVGRKTGRSFGLGDVLKVTIASVNVAARKIDLRPTGAGEAAGEAPHGARGEGRRPARGRGRWREDGERREGREHERGPRRGGRDRRHGTGKGGGRDQGGRGGKRKRRGR